MDGMAKESIRLESLKRVTIYAVCYNVSKIIIKHSHHGN